MLCNECGKNQATVHSVQYINGAKSEVHLCAECAKHHPELNMNLFSTGDFFKSFFDDFIPGKGPSAKAAAPASGISSRAGCLDARIAMIPSEMPSSPF